MTWISSTVLICMHIFIYVTSLYIRCLDIWMFQRKWWVTRQAYHFTSSHWIPACLRTSRSLLQDLQAKGGDGQEVSHLFPGFGTARLHLILAGHVNSCCLSYQFCLFIPFHDQPNLKPKRFFDDMTNSFFPAETVQQHFCESQKHIRKLETPACWVVIGVTVFASWTLPGVSPREVHHLTACGTACTACTGREDRGCRGDGVGDARGERLGAIIHLGVRILLSQRVNQKKS